MKLKVFKIIILIAYIGLACFLLIESAIPGSKSAQQSNKVSNFSEKFLNVFVKNKTTLAEDIIINNEIKDSYQTNESLTIDAYISPSNASYQSISYSSTNDDILSINNKGEVTFNDSGTASIIVEQPDSNLKKEIPINVTKYVAPVVEKVYPTSFTLVVDYYTLHVGNYILLRAIFNPTTSNQNGITLTVSDTSILGKYGNYVYGVSPGVATVTAKTANGLEKSVDITVIDATPIKPEKFNVTFDKSITNNSNIMTVGTKSQINFTYNEDESEVYKKCLFSSSDSSVLSVDSKGLMVAKKTGFARITCKSLNGEYSVTNTIFVRNVLPSFALKDVSIPIDESYRVEIKPYNEGKITYDNYIYSSSNEEVAKIDENGIVTPVGIGSTLISVYVNDGYYKVEKSFTLEIRNRSIVDNVKFNFSLFVRKFIGHFAAFGLLGVLASLTYALWVKKKFKKFPLWIPIALISGFAIAGISELIQKITPGRAGLFSDVMIDFSGYFIAYIVVVIIYIIRCKKIKKNIIDNQETPE